MCVSMSSHVYTVWRKRSKKQSLYTLDELPAA